MSACWETKFALLQLKRCKIKIKTTIYIFLIKKVMLKGWVGLTQMKQTSIFVVFFLHLSLWLTANLFQCWKIHCTANISNACQHMSERTQTHVLWTCKIQLFCIHQNPMIHFLAALPPPHPLTPTFIDLALSKSGLAPTPTKARQSLKSIV